MVFHLLNLLKLQSSMFLVEFYSLYLLLNQSKEYFAQNLNWRLLLRCLATTLILIVAFSNDIALSVIPEYISHPLDYPKKIVIFVNWVNCCFKNKIIPFLFSLNLFTFFLVCFNIISYFWMYWNEHSKVMEKFWYMQAKKWYCGK